MARFSSHQEQPETLEDSAEGTVAQLKLAWADRLDPRGLSPRRSLQLRARPLIRPGGQKASLPGLWRASPRQLQAYKRPFSPGSGGSELKEAPKRRVHVPIPHVCECALVGSRCPQWGFS